MSLASRSSRVSSSEKRRLSARISLSSPASRRRWRPISASSRVASTVVRFSGSRARSSLRQPSASSEDSSCRSSITRRTGSSSDSSAVSKRSSKAEPRKLGVGAIGSTSCLRPVAAVIASTTPVQKCCASRSPGSTETHATRSSVCSVHERSSTVLPLPAGAQTRPTPPRGIAERRSNSPSRRTNRPRAPRRCEGREFDLGPSWILNCWWSGTLPAP